MVTNPSLMQLFWAFLKLGATAFGGPAMIPYIGKMAIEQMRWLTDQTFREGVALCQTIPGATAMQTSAYIGFRARGVAGAAVSLIGAWVSSGYPERDVFTFTDIDGLTCEATYGEDVEPLFLESNLWYPGSLSCASCHNADLTVSSAQMDMTTYAGLLAGSRRTSPDAKGNDVLGGGDWEASLMYDVLYVRKYMPLGRPPEVPAEGPVVFAGTAIQDGMQ